MDGGLDGWMVDLKDGWTDGGCILQIALEDLTVHLESQDLDPENGY